MAEPYRSRRRVAVHPLLVTVPIGAWVASFIFDVASWFGASPDFLTQGSYWLIGIGLLGAVVATLAGFAAAMPIPPESEAHRKVIAHLCLAMPTIVLYAISYIVRDPTESGHQAGAAPVALSVAGLLVLLATVVVGNTITHRYRTAAVPATHRGDVDTEHRDA